jgi:glycosyltransferase involved in cell wall biosynthesis
MNVPDGMNVELIVVDNGSTDGTGNVIEAFKSAKLRVVHLCIPAAGKANACNAALKASSGVFLLFTDDDVRVPRDWLSRMTAPLISGEAHAVAGKVRMARRLERSWMQKTHYFRLADTRFRPSDDFSMIGANMAFHRTVLEEVPQFDDELGPGRSGMKEETLFSQQLLKAGFTIFQSDCEVEHHFEETRLCRGAWLRHGKASGVSASLVCFHWEHRVVRYALLLSLFWKACGSVYRLMYPKQSLEEEGCDRVEIRIVENCAFYSHYRKLGSLIPKYAKFGLRPRV